MMIRNIQVRVLVAAVAALGASASVMAGVRETARTVVVNQTTRFAQGHLAGARASTDGTQYIGCSTWARDDLPNQDGGTYRQGICYATDARGVSAFCMTSDPALLSVIATLQGDSLLNFNWNSSGVCVQVDIRQGSSLEPKR
jgi:hypothetical protein